MRETQVDYAMVAASHGEQSKETTGLGGRRDLHSPERYSTTLSCPYAERLQRCHHIEVPAAHHPGFLQYPLPRPDH
eukprot:scaffold49_cov409-Prasinococcus_capsulatus_cf.AAC.13